jgi:DNA-binding response OmpR family regulator
MSTIKQKILIADDEPDIIELIQYNLTKEGYQIFTARNGQEAVLEAKRALPDLIILDMMMPRMDGFTLTRTIRESGSMLPILMLTAKDMPQDKHTGFIVGTDDYMTKPPDRQELVLRIKALLRRARIVDEHRITIGDVELDYDTHTVRRGHDAQVLPPKEFNLLYKLLAYPERTFTRLELLDEIWGMDSESDDKTVNVHINRLRTRFYDWPEFEIQTIRGIGYRAIKKV